jgi:tetratricopeptide (TPR) repeat protein
VKERTDPEGVWNMDKPKQVAKATRTALREKARRKTGRKQRKPGSGTRGGTRSKKLKQRSSFLEKIRSYAPIIVALCAIVGILLQIIRNEGQAIDGCPVQDISDNRSPFPWCGGDTKSIENCQRAGLRAIDWGDWVGACSELEVAVTSHPQCPLLKALHALSIFMSGGSAKEIETAFPRSIDLNKLPKDENYLLRGIDDFCKGNYEPAARFLNDLVDRFPEHLWGHFLLAESLRRMGKSEASIASFLQVIKLHPASPAILATISRTYLFNMGNSEQSEEYYRQTIEVDEGFDDSGFRCIPVHLAMLRGDLISANAKAEDLVLAVESSSYTRIQAWVLLGQMHVLVGQFSQALDDIRQATRLADSLGFDDIKWAAMIDGGRLQVWLSDFDEDVIAPELFAVMRNCPASFRFAALSLGVMDALNGRDEFARTIMAQLADLPYSAEMQSFMSCLITAARYLGAGHYNQALYNAEIVMNLLEAGSIDHSVGFEAEVLTHYCRGIALEKLGKTERALMDFEWIIGHKVRCFTTTSYTAVMVYIVSQHHCAVLHDRLRQSTEALDHLNTFREHWLNAERELPETIDAEHRIRWLIPNPDCALGITPLSL